MGPPAFRSHRADRGRHPLPGSTNGSWPGQTVRGAGEPQTVSRGALPDTVTCGSGYIEVLAFVEGGIVINEVRTQATRHRHPQFRAG